MPEYKPVPRNGRQEAGNLPAQNSAQTMLSGTQGLDLLNQNIRAIYMALNQQHIEHLQEMPVIPFSSTLSEKDMEDKISVYRIDKILYNEQENTHEKLVSVFSALHSYVNAVTMIIKSDGKEVSLYLCTSANDPFGTAGSLLESNVRGQFPGSKLTKIVNNPTNKTNKTEKTNFLRSLDVTDQRIIRSVSVIPGKRKEETEQQRNFTSQGFEKLIDSMSGRKYTLLVVSRSVPTDVIEAYKTSLENLATLISPYKEESVSFAYNKATTAGYNFSNNFSNAVNESISNSFGTSHTQGVSSGHSKGSSWNFYGWGGNDSNMSGQMSSDAITENKAIVSGTVLTAGSTSGLNTSDTEGFTQTYNVSRENKAIANILAMIDEHLERINANRIYGMWECSCYLLSDDIETASISSSTLQSLLTSDDTVSAEIFCNQWGKEKEGADKRKMLMQYIRNFQHPQFSCHQIAVPNLQDKTGKPQEVTPGLMVSGNELPIIMGLPKKSVPGVTVTEMAEFGRNLPAEWKVKATRTIPFGKIQHMGSDDIGEVLLDINAFSSHCFITGASGSGKSNATYHILKNLCDSGVKFLVIEPTKGEYKSVFGNYREMFGNNPNKRVNIFTTNPRQARMLRINPFEFHPRVHIQEHISRLVGTISACWPLEGAMPAFLKKAFEGIYTKCGWDLNHSEQIVRNDKEFPDFHDLEEVMADIIENTNYSAEIKGNYQGALLTRIGAMTNGFEGQIFCGNRGVSDKTLFDENCIIDLSNIGSQETRALIMGLLIIRLKEYRYATAREPNTATKHITVLEEAHNILKRCSHEQSSSSANILGSSVEMLTACIAEMRTYGEGFMIIDQSPSAVDITAIKNTAIKVVLRLPEEQDCKEIGNALTLSEEKVRELSRLDVGVAAVFHTGWNETVLAKSSEFNPKETITGKRKYSEKEVKEVDHTELIKIRAVILIELYQSFLARKLKSAYCREIVDLIQEKSSVDFKTLSDGKSDELIEIVTGFFASNEQVLESADKAAIKQRLFLFAIELLQMRDLFDIIDVKQGQKQIQMDKSYGWYLSFTRAMSKYALLPAGNFDRKPGIQNEEQPTKLLNELCGNIIEAYSKSIKEKRPELNEVWEYLSKQGCFK